MDEAVAVTHKVLRHTRVAKGVQEYARAAKLGEWVALFAACDDFASLVLDGALALLDVPLSDEARVEVAVSTRAAVRAAMGAPGVATFAQAKHELVAFLAHAVLPYYEEKHGHDKDAALTAVERVAKALREPGTAHKFATMAAKFNVSVANVHAWTAIDQFEVRVRKAAADVWAAHLAPDAPRHVPVDARVRCARLHAHVHA